MVRIVAAAALALAACGRLHFEDTPDAVLGHDEDGDGIPDVDDPCPHVPGDRADRDGDGVGDACDPNPDTPTESFLIFATMQPGDNPFDSGTTGFVQDADDLDSVGSTAPSITRSLGTARIDIGFDIRSVIAGANQHQVALGVNPAVAGTTYYFSELNQQAGVTDFGVISYDSMNGYVTVASETFPTMHTGSGYMRLDVIASSAPPTTRIEGGWTGELYDQTGNTPSYTTGNRVRFAFNGLDVAIRYVVVIVTQ